MQNSGHASFIFNTACLTMASHVNHALLHSLSAAQTVFNNKFKVVPLAGIRDRAVLFYPGALPATVSLCAAM